MSAPENVEPIVLELVKEYLSKKAFFSLREVIEFVNNRVKRNPNINRNRIELVLKALIKKKVILPGTKLMKDNIVENPTRNNIFIYIKKNPGVNINEIMKKQGIGSNQVLWHLSALEKFQFIRSREIGNRKIFFKFDSNQELDEIHFYLKVDIVKEIIQFMRKKEISIKITDIAEGLKKNHNTIKKYLDVLGNLKLIIIEKEKTRATYKLNMKRYTQVVKFVRKK